MSYSSRDALHDSYCPHLQLTPWDSTRKQHAPRSAEPESLHVEGADDDSPWNEQLHSDEPLHS